MWDYSGAVGGRIVRNKLWFFVSGRSEGYNREILNAFYPDGTPILIETDQAFHSEKLQWQLSPQNKVTLFYHGALDIQRRGASQFRPPESMEIHRGPVSMYKGEWQNVRGNSMVASLQYGNWYKHAYYFALPGYNGEGHKVATIDDSTQYVTGDHLSDQRVEDYFRNHFKGSVSIFGSDFIGPGTHQVKTGFDYLFGGYPHKNGSRPGGNYQLHFQNSVPFSVDTFNYPVRPFNDNSYLGLYLQDAWAINRRLNLSLGVRYANDNAYAPPQCLGQTDFAPAACYDKIQMRVWHSVVPRIHFALDLMGDGKSVLKGGYGMFVNLREVNPEVVTANRNNRTTTNWVWHDNNNNRLLDSGEINFDPNGGDFRSISGVTDAVPNPEEVQPKSDEWSLTFEREIKGRWGVRSTAVYARNYDLRRTEEIYRPYSAYNIAITNPDPGADGRPGTSDDPGTTQTYWDVPAHPERPAIRRYHAGRLARQPGLQDLRGRRNEAAGRRLADERVDVVHPGRCGFRRSSGSESKFRDQHGRAVLGKYCQDIWRVRPAVGDHRVGKLRAKAGCSAVATGAVHWRPDHSIDRAQHRSVGDDPAAEHEPGGFPVRETI